MAEEGGGLGKVLPLTLEEEVKQSYLDYAMSVIVGRAIPDARDGLKPVQRRILYSMLELGLRSNQPYKKSARIVGETMGKYHPHGDAAIYDALARMAQDFSMRYPLIDGQGNFGSIDGDPPAAMRYSEARLSPLGEEMLADIDEDTVDWGPNFDESLREPLVLPALLPNLLLNGSSGIAVGMATNIPPHNLGEVIDALCLFIEKDGNVELDEILSVLPGPDFPTGGIIMGREGIVDAYRTGRGKLIVRGKAHEEESGRGRKAVVITEIPYMVNKASLVETIAREAKEGRINGVADIRDESDRRGLRIVIELQRDADPDLALRQLYTRTQLQTTFGVINLALVDAKPMTLPLLELLRVFVEHRRSVVRRRTAFRLKKAEERAHLVEGLVRALDMIDQVIALIRSSKDARSAEAGLVQEFGFTQAQAKAILDMRLQRLTNLERHKLEEELASLLQDISRYNAILTSPKLLDSVVRDELVALKDRYSDSRRTEISDSVEILAEEELIPESEIVVVLSRDGYLRRMPIGDYRSQGRGGKGVKGINLSSEDEIARLIVTTTHRNVYFFTSEGRVFAIRGYVIPEAKSGKGKNVSRFLSLGENEEIVTLGDSCTERAKFVFFITKRGNAKRLSVSELEGLTSVGRRVMGFEDGDAIARVRFTSGEDELVLVTASGQALRIDEREIPPQGRAARGVRAMRLAEGDRLVGCDIVRPGRKMFLISELGVGKLVEYDEFSRHHRGGMGVRAMRLTGRTGSLVGSWGVGIQDEVFVITGKGRIIRLSVNDMPVMSRSATGYILVRLDEGDVVADVSVIHEDVAEGD